MDQKPQNPQLPQTNVTPPDWPAETPQQVPVEAEPPTAPMPPSSFDAQPALSTPIPPVIGTAKKSKKKLLIIIAVIIVLLIGSAAAVFAFWYQNPDKMVSDGIIQTLQAKTTSYKGVISVDSSVIKIKADLDGAYVTGAQNVNADITLSFGNVDYKLKGGVLIDANTDIYVKIANLDAVVTPLRTMVSEQSQQTFDSTIKKIDDKWIKIDATELATYSPGISKVQSCISNAVQQTENNTSLLKEIEDNYKKYPFVTTSEKLGDRSGSTGFVLTTDQEKAKSFAVALKETQVYKTLHGCDNDLMIDETKFFAGMGGGTPTRTELWVNTWNHQITTLNVTGKSANSGVTTTLTLNPTFNTNVSVKTPSDAVTLKDLQDDLGALQQIMIQYRQAGSTKLPSSPQG